jgi:hypothetical protein
MKFLDRLFSQQPSAERTDSRDLWNPAGVGRLLNEDLHRALEAVASEPSVKDRQRLYELLSTITYCVPSHQNEAGSLAIPASRNAQGEMVMGVFTDPPALKRWAPGAAEFLAIAAWKLFDIMLQNGFAEIVINPAGPVSGKLTRAEVERLMRGEIPL